MNDWKKELLLAAKSIGLQTKPKKSAPKQVTALQKKPDQKKEQGSKKCSKSSPKKSKSQRRYDAVLRQNGIEPGKKLSRVDRAILAASRTVRPYAGIPSSDEKPCSVHAMGQIWNRFDLFSKD